MDEVVKIKKKRWPFAVGIIVLALAVFGAVTLVNTVSEVIREKTSSVEDYKEYASFLTWVVGVDPNPFDDIEKADKAELLNIALCSLLSDETKTGKYEMTDDGLKVPAADVEVKFNSMFGGEVKPEHATVTGYGYEFKYDSAAMAYTVPLIGVVPPFSARIDSVKQKAGLIILKVGYVGTSNIEVNANGELAATQPDKYMQITLKKTDTNLNLVSVTNLSEGEALKAAQQ